jgi:mRNA-degrading endonuclease YafQ of YafQ-DinJ toxin-antitoxin module
VARWRKGQSGNPAGRPVGRGKPRPPRERPVRTNNIYIIQQGEYYKIGISREVHRRLGVLQASTPYSCSLVYALETDDALEIEARLHDRYKDHCVVGEWFDLTDKQLSEAITTINRMAGTIESDAQLSFHVK